MDQEDPEWFVVDRLCPKHHGYVRRCRNCCEILRKISQELFAREKADDTKSAQINNLETAMAKLKCENYEQKNQIGSMELKLKTLGDIYDIPGLPGQRWPIAICLSRHNGSRLIVNTNLVAALPDCAVDINGLDKEGMDLRIVRKIKNNYYQPEQTKNKSFKDFKKPVVSEGPKGMKNLFSSKTPNLKTMLGTNWRHEKHVKRKRQETFMEKMFTSFGMAMNKTESKPVDDDQLSVISYTSTDQNECNITLPMRDRFEKQQSVMKRAKQGGGEFSGGEFSGGEHQASSSGAVQTSADGDIGEEMDSDPETSFAVMKDQLGSIDPSSGYREK